MRENSKDSDDGGNLSERVRIGRTPTVLIILFNILIRFFHFQLCKSH